MASAVRSCGSLDAQPAPGTTVTEVPPAAAEPTRTSVGGVRTPGPPPSGGPRLRLDRQPSARPKSDTELSAEGHDRLQAELDELRTVMRPAAIARVATAREHGDLKENAEYHAAREELGFIEGRIQALEARLRNAVIVDSAGSATAMLGSTVVVEVEGDDERIAISSSARQRRARRMAGCRRARRSEQAIVGRSAGEYAIVRTPGGEIATRVIEVR